MIQKERKKTRLASFDGNGQKVEIFEFVPRPMAESIPVCITAKPWTNGTTCLVPLTPKQDKQLFVIEMNGESVLNTHNQTVAWDKFNSCIGLDQVGA